MSFDDSMDRYWNERIPSEGGRFVSDQEMEKSFLADVQRELNSLLSYVREHMTETITIRDWFYQPGIGGAMLGCPQFNSLDLWLSREKIFLPLSTPKKAGEKISRSDRFVGGSELIPFLEGLLARIKGAR